MNILLFFFFIRINSTLMYVDNKENRRISYTYSKYRSGKIKTIVLRFR